MKKRFILLMALTAAMLHAEAQMPQCKVDISQSGRQADEVVEPGYTAWQNMGEDLTVEGVTFSLSVPTGATASLRTGWNKAFIQKAENKAKNGRLTGDGVNLDPNECGEFSLTIKGLPVGTHTIQTYHNRWQDPAQFTKWPISVKCNDKEVHTAVSTTFQGIIASDVTVLLTTFAIQNAGDEAVLTFITRESEGPEDASKTKFDRTPILNGFELNTANAVEQAKRPSPTSGNMHADADDGTCLLSWSPANESVVQHLIYVGTDSTEVAEMTTPMYSQAKNDTTLLLTDLNNLNTYWWRVDEVDGKGNVTTGNIWSFRPRQLAFPGAEGYGRFAIGGRGGSVYHVTNLKNDHQPGSFLYGLVDVEGPRTIVFDVSGIIDMDYAAVFVDDYVTIAAQTAPGKGICLKHSNLNIGSDNICRFLRARRGYGDTGNAMGITGADHAIIDHSSALWGTDETFSSRNGKNITFQYNMIAEALGIADHKNYSSGTNHGYAATIGGDIGTFSHNLLADCQGRNWSLGGGLTGDGYYAGRLDIFNNVVYNWGGRATDGGAHEVNFVNNFYKVGPANGTKTLLKAQLEGTGLGTQSYYVSGNIRQAINNGAYSYDKYGDTYKYTLSGGQTLDWDVFVDKPFFPSYATIHSAEEAYKIVLSDVGATMPCRDEQHLRMIRETSTGTYTYVGSRSGIKGQIDNESDCGGFEVFPEDTRDESFDTDGDGIPNWFEILIGSDGSTANNNDDPNHDGWTLLEDYLEFMAHPYVVLAPEEQTEVNLAQYFRGYTKSPIYSVADNKDVNAAVSDSVITVKAGKDCLITTLQVSVVDADGASLTLPLNVAVSGNATAIKTVSDEKNLEDAVSRKFYTLDGKEVTRLHHCETYIMKTTNKQGQTYSVKILAD